MNETATSSETPLLAEFFPERARDIPHELAAKIEKDFERATTLIAGVFADIFVDNLRGRMKARKLAGVAV